MDEGLTSQTIKAIDDFTINEIGVPSMVLMERAALAITEKLLEKDSGNDVSYDVICGAGNNGGDGLAIARMLHQAGRKVTIHLVGNTDSSSEAFKQQLFIAENLDLPIISFNEEPDSLIADVVIDALFGIGLNRDVEEPHKTAIERINQCKGRVIAVDVPSGLSADTGEVLGTAVRAETTYTIGFKKKGFNSKNAKAFIGNLEKVSIGYPDVALLEDIIEKEQTHG